MRNILRPKFRLSILSFVFLVNSIRSFNFLPISKSNYVRSSKAEIWFQTIAPPKFNFARLQSLDSSSESNSSLVALTEEISENLKGEVSIWEKNNENSLAVSAEDSIFSEENLPSSLSLKISELSKEKRLEIYTNLLFECLRPNNQMNLSEVRTMRKIAKVLCPLKNTENDRPQLSVENKKAVESEAIIEANLRAIKKLVQSLPESFSEEEHMELGGWILFVLDFMKNRPIAGKYSTKDDQAVGMYFYLAFEEKKLEYEGKKRSKLFSLSVRSLVPSSSFCFGSDFESWKEMKGKISKGIESAFSDANPLMEDAIFWLRVRARPCIGDMIHRSAALFDVENGLSEQNEKSSKEAMDSFQLLTVAIEFSRLILRFIILYDNGYLKTNKMAYASYVDEHLFGVAPEFRKVERFHSFFAEKFIQSALKGQRNMESINRYDLLLFRRLLSMSETTCHRLNFNAYKNLVGQALKDDARSPVGSPGFEIADCLQLLEDGLEVAPENTGLLRESAFQVYMENFLGSKEDQSIAEEAGTWACDFLGIPREKIAETIETQRSRALAQCLQPFVRPEEDYRREPFRPEEIEEIGRVIESSGLSEESVAKVLLGQAKALLQSFLARAGEKMRKKQVEEGSLIVNEIREISEGLVAQLQDMVPSKYRKKISMKDKLSDSEEFWITELCWALIDKDADAEAPNLVLDLIGIK